ncbi:uncharacterized [Tachysurus ichikawai]
MDSKLPSLTSPSLQTGFCELSDRCFSDVHLHCIMGDVDSQDHQDYGVEALNNNHGDVRSQMEHVLRVPFLKLFTFQEECYT